MFPSESMFAIPREQFTRQGSAYTGRTFRRGQSVLLIPALILGVLAWFARPTVPEVAAILLPMVTVLAGGSTLAAMSLSDKRIAARRDPRLATNGRALIVLDDAGLHASWTAVVAISTLAVLVVVAIVVPVAVRPLGALIAFLVGYLLTLMIAGLHMMTAATAALKS